MSSAPTEAPAPRVPGRYTVELVCLGNICRSPTAAVVLRDRVADAGLDDRVDVVSSGTGGWHVDAPMDRRAAATLRGAGYDEADVAAHRGRQHGTGTVGERGADLVLAMDADNLAGLHGAVDAERLAMFRAFDPLEPGADVPDPYYGGEDGFEEVLTMVERTADSLVGSIASALDRAPEDRSGAGL